MAYFIFQRNVCRWTGKNIINLKVSLKSPKINVTGTELSTIWIMLNVQEMVLHLKNTLYIRIFKATSLPLSRPAWYAPGIHRPHIPLYSLARILCRLGVRG
jgi:hypothetical protein